MRELKIESINMTDINEYSNNAKLHPDWQIEQIANSIKKFGFNDPIAINENNTIIEGHGRYIACKRLGFQQVPCIRLTGMSDTEERAYILAHNKLTMNTDFDIEKLQYELNALKVEEFNIELTGFDMTELDEILSQSDFLEGISGSFAGDGEETDEDFEYEDSEGLPSGYTTKIQTPVYEIKGEEPLLEELYDHTKVDELIEEIKRSNLSEEKKEFLLHRAYQLTKFDFGKVAEYYAHQDKDMQNLMEKMAMVIIDFDKALEYGFVRMSKTLREIVGEELVEHENEKE